MYICGQGVCHITMELAWSIWCWSQPDKVLASDTCLVGGGGCFNEKVFSLPFSRIYQESRPQQQCFTITHRKSAYMKWVF